MVFWRLRKGNTQNFLEQFHDRLSLHIVAVFSMAGWDEAMLQNSMKIFLENHHEYAFVQRGDRSVQGHINDVFMNLMYEQYRWEDDDPTRIPQQNHE